MKSKITNKFRSETSICFKTTVDETRNESFPKKIFEIKCDSEWEKNLRCETDHKKAFENSSCVFCKRLVSNKKKKNHFIQCKMKDLCYDPFREKVTTAWVRDFRHECKVCEQRFFKKHKNSIGHKYCRHSMGNKTLCLYCDRYFIKIWNHKKTCKTFKLYTQHKNLIMRNYFNNRRIFLSRVNKITKFFINNKQTYTSKLDSKIDSNKFRKFFEKYGRVVESQEKNSKSGVIKKPKRVEYLPRSFLNYDGFPVSMAVDYTIVKPVMTCEEKDALRGMISWENYFEREQRLDNLRKNRRRKILDENPELEFEIEMNKLKLERLEEDRILNTQLEKLNAIKNEEISSNQDFLVPEDSNLMRDDSILAPRSPKPDYFEFCCLKNHPNFKILRQQTKRLYQITFENFNKTLEGYLKSKETILLLKNNSLVGAMTFEIKLHKQIKYVDLLLLGVDHAYQNQGLGTKLIKHLISQFEKIIAWVDLNAVEFYKKLGFREYATPKNHKKILTYMTDSIIMGHEISDLININ